MRQFSSLDDFLAWAELTVDERFDDGFGELYPVKGREIDATILFSDISNFTSRTHDLPPVATLSFVNHFFTWIGAEALKYGNGIVDKYLGDEARHASRVCPCGIRQKAGCLVSIARKVHRGSRSDHPSKLKLRLTPEWLEVNRDEVTVISVCHQLPCFLLPTEVA